MPQGGLLSFTSVITFIYMLRRRFVLNILGIAALPCLNQLSFFSIFNRGMHVCLIQIKFPPNYSKEQFYADRKRWMSISSYEEIVEAFERRGLLVKKDSQVSSSDIKMAYYFKDIESHDDFVDIIGGTNAVSDRKLQDIGYEYSRKYFQV